MKSSPFVRINQLLISVAFTNSFAARRQRIPTLRISNYKMQNCQFWHPDKQRLIQH